MDMRPDKLKFKPQAIMPAAYFINKDSLHLLFGYRSIRTTLCPKNSSSLLSANALLSKDSMASGLFSFR